MMLISSVESELAVQDERRMVARTTGGWLLALLKNLDEVEQDTKEAFENRRKLAKLLVERIVVGRDKEGLPKVDVTYRFGPPEHLQEESAYGGHNSEAFSRAQWGGRTTDRSPQDDFLSGRGRAGSRSYLTG